MNDSEIEQEIQAKGKTAPRITPADIEINIASEHFFTAEHGVSGAMAALELHQRTTHTGHEGTLRLLTFCVLVLRNGFTVTGESACASPENFDAEIGRQIARQNAVQKIWPLMGYELRSHLANKMPCTCGPYQACSRCPRPVLTEGDAQADLDGTRRPDHHTD